MVSGITAELMYGCYGYCYKASKNHPMEHNTDLALYSSVLCKKGQHHIGECIPEPLEVGSTYEFIKKGHRTYDVPGQVTLLEMRPDEVLFDLKARVEVTKVTYAFEDGNSYTKGQYRVLEILQG